MPVDPRFTTRAFRDGDEAAILDLFNRSFPHSPRSVEHFDWKYRDNPFGSRRISLTFDAGGKLVGHYAGYSVPFRYGSKDIVAHQIGDTMTDPAIRHVGRGPTSILGRTALHFYASFCEGQVAFNYGFNVANIQKFSLKFLRSDRVEPVTYRVAPKPRPISRGERWLRGYRLEEVVAVWSRPQACLAGAGRKPAPHHSEFDDLFARVAGAYPFLVRRDARYVQWRYLDCPDVPYIVVAIRKLRQLVGWIVCRVVQNRFLLGDLLIHPAFPDALEVALRHVAWSHPVDTIETWVPPRPDWLDRTLRDLGFETRPQPQDLSVMCVPFTWPDATAKMRQSLFYTWGDSDLF